MLKNPADGTYSAAVTKVVKVVYKRVKLGHTGGMGSRQDLQSVQLGYKTHF